MKQNNTMVLSGFGIGKLLKHITIHNFANQIFQSILVFFEDIKEKDCDLSINRYKEIVYEEVEYDAPEEILKRIKKLNNQRIEINNELSNLLS